MHCPNTKTASVAQARSHQDPVHSEEESCRCFGLETAPPRLKLTSLARIVALCLLLGAGGCGRPVLDSNPSSNSHDPGMDTAQPPSSEWRGPGTQHFRLLRPAGRVRRGQDPWLGVRGAGLAGASSLAGSQAALAGLQGAKLTAAGHLLGGEASPGGWLAPQDSGYER